MSPSKKRASDAALKELRAIGLAYPGAHTKSPWPGHLDLAVKDKTFAFLSVEGEPFSISCKLPDSGEAALMLPFAKPTPYGLGKSGWVSAAFPDEPPPVTLLKQWIEESYRAVAPKKLAAQLAEPAVKGAVKTAAKGKLAAKGKPAANAKPAAKTKLAAKGEPAAKGKLAAKGKPAAKGKLAAKGKPAAKAKESTRPKAR